MSGANADRYNELVQKSQIKSHFGNDSYGTINDRLIPCNEILNFYKDSLFYMHLFNTLYLELLMYDRTNGHNLENFNKIIKNLQLGFDTSTTTLSSTDARLGVLTPNITDEGTSTYNFRIGLFNEYYHNVDAYQYYNQAVSQTRSSAQFFTIDVNLPSSDPTSIGGTPARLKIAVDMNTGVIQKLNIAGDAADNSTANTKYVHISDGGTRFPRSRTIYNSDYNNTLIDLRVGGDVFGNNFRNSIADVKFDINAEGRITAVTLLTTIRGSRQFTTFTVNNISDIDNYKPKIANIPLLETGFSYDFANNVLDTSIGSGSGTSRVFKKNQNNNFNINEAIATNNTYDNANVRKKKFRKIISDILNTPTQNIFGYLLYQKMYYNCIVCNTSIQIVLRHTYLNANINLLVESGTTGNSAIIAHGTTINTFIQTQTTNLNQLRSIATTASNDYVADKNFVVDRMLLLNDLKRDFNETLESLNGVVNNYNRYILYYNKLKKYVSGIILFLIILIVASILITISPTFDYNAKNTYYIVILITLIVITIIYYLNFRHVSLYEKFATATNETITAPTIRITTSTFNTNCTSYTKGKDMRNQAEVTTGVNAEIRNNNNNHAAFANQIFAQSENLTNYNYTYLLLSNDINSAIFVSNNKVFSEGGNDYLYKLYTEKVRQNDLNKLKKAKFGNIIEAIKKQIIYLFNIALLISLVAIVLVICLIFYNFGVVNIGYIFTFAVIALIIIMFYMNYIMIQQTRMLASKKYWSVNNPSEVTLDQL